MDINAKIYIAGHRGMVGSAFSVLWKPRVFTTLSHENLLNLT